MKYICVTLFAMLAAVQLPAATNDAPVKLAIVSESPDAAAAADLLTVELTKNDRVQLLERAEIEKVYREQGLSAANKDYSKLGQILGADGLLLLNVASAPTPANVSMFGSRQKTLTARLIAVKPGVVLTDGALLWPVKDTVEWSASFAAHLNLLIPKLGVLVKDAIPISVVNLRSAIKSDEAKETEQEVKSLTIQRLSGQPQFFVLERQRMQLLGEEKQLQSDESAFWNGSYLLEGVIDQNGYSENVVTINARLTPPKGGEPLLFQISGSRTNLAEAANKLVAKVAELLKVNSAVKEWNAADEAAQYFGEAQWALRWKIYSEAQMAADSAWALGKKDLDCALLRIKAYVAGLSADIGNFQSGEIGISASYDTNGRPVEIPHLNDQWNKMIQQLKTQHKIVSITKMAPLSRMQASYVWSDKDPVAENIDQAVYALALYKEFSRTSPDGEPKILSRGKGWNDWHNSDWYQLGTEDLVAASKVLQNYNLMPEAQEPVGDKLADLRSLARSTAEEISAAPSVHDSYFVGDRVVNRDELSRTMEEHDSIFRCEIDWGCYWQETPEGCLALYRELLASPVFCYLHHDFWNPAPPASRLVAWNAEDQKRIPAVWNNFVGELSDSTNVLWQMEAKALVRADATNDDQVRAAEAGWWSIVRFNRAELVDNNVELFYLGWGFISNPETQAMDSEYGQKLGEKKDRQAHLADFEKQKQFLNGPLSQDFFPFPQIFSYRNYTKAQALEIEPLVADYKSNLVAQSKTATGISKLKLGNAIADLGYLENDLNRILNPPAPVPQPSSQPQTTPALLAPLNRVAEKPPARPDSGLPSELVTNVLPVTKFLPIPMDGLPGDKHSAVTIVAHHWLEGRLLLDFQYNAFVYAFDEKTNWTSTRSVTFPAIAMLDPGTEHWNVISCPEVNLAAQSHFYHHTTLLHGELFTSDGGQIRKYNYKQRQWQVLACSSGDNYELFTVNDRLYAANANLIFEITDGGKSTRILASSRRQPLVSVLDTQELGTPALFAGPDNSLRVTTQNKLFTWTGGDWREDAAVPPSMFSPEIFLEGVLFRYSSSSSAPPDSLSRLLTGKALELCLGPKPRAPGSEEPIWKLPPQMFLENLAGALCQSNLYLLAGHSEIQKIANDRHEIVMEKVVANDGYNAALLCYSQGSPRPQKVFLNFEAPGSCPPLAGVDPLNRGFPSLPPALLVFAGDKLLFAAESPVSVMPIGFQRSPAGYSAGVWVMPVERLAPAIAAQKQLQPAEAAQSAAVTEQAAKNLLAKYDLNHNGVIDLDERENALDDPAFIQAHLDEIDANRNGWLDPSELAWFDTNQNKVLDPKEQAGIDLAEKLLAKKLLDQFDREGNGWLDRMEYDQMIESSLRVNPNVDFGLQFPHADSNHDNHLDLEELESLMRRQLEEKLQTRELRRPSNLYPMAMGDRPPVESRQRFKSAVEAYWQNSGRNTQPPAGGGIPSGTNNP